MDVTYYTSTMIMLWASKYRFSSRIHKMIHKVINVIILQFERKEAEMLNAANSVMDPKAQSGNMAECTITTTAGNTFHEALGNFPRHFFSGTTTASCVDLRVEAASSDANFLDRETDYWLQDEPLNIVSLSKSDTGPVRNRSTL